jgi:hypothetical protein
VNLVSHFCVNLDFFYNNEHVYVTLLLLFFYQSAQTIAGQHCRGCISTMWTISVKKK